MKFDEQLAAYLYEKKSLRLEGIGTFTLDGKVGVPSTQEKEIYYPIEGLSFIYNPKSNTDEELIAFLVQKLHKIQPLVRSDLESYLSNIKQFINLGKPYTIEGIGTLSKNNQGTYEFTPGNFLPAKEELNPRRENAEHNYPVRSQSSAGRVFVVILIVIAALAALGGIGWGISNFISKSEPTSTDEVQEQGSIDTIPQANSDTIASPQLELAPRTAEKDESADTGDSIRYKMFFETTRWKERAGKRTAQLNALRSYTKVDTVRVGDSLRYRLYLPMKIGKADTTRLYRIKDSLRIFFGGKIIAERQ